MSAARKKGARGRHGSRGYSTGDRGAPAAEDGIRAGATPAPESDSVRRGISAALRWPHLLLLGLLSAAASIWVSGGGLVHVEASGYIPHYLAERPLLQKLFDSRVFDQWLFQARELSYLLDYLDCQFIAAGVRAGYPHFLSLTHYVLSVLIGVLAWLFLVDDAGQDRLAATLLVLLFWTSPGVFLGGFYFRSSKIGLAFLVVMAVVFLHREESGKSGGRPLWRAWLILFILLCAATLLDRQGVFMTGMALLYLALRAISWRTRRNVALLSAPVVALAFSLFYTYVLCPWITFALNGYRPSFAYHYLPLDQFFGEPGRFLGAGLSLFLDTFRFLYGDLPVAYGALALASLIWLFFRGVGWRCLEFRTARERVVFGPAAGVALVTVCLIVLLNALMVLRHYPVQWPDLRRIYYWLPTSALLLVTVPLALGVITERRLLSPNVLRMGLLALLIGNVAALPGHREFLLKGHLKPGIEFAPKLIGALRPPKGTPVAVGPDVAGHMVYQFFRARAR